MTETARATPEGPVAELEHALEHGMTEGEYDKVLDTLGRKPTVTELGMYSVMWSEHCSYKSSRVHLRTLPTEGEAVLQGPGENAGAVDLGHGLAGVFKVESHNHPSYIEPYQGAATGVGGILRDIFTMGARPLALLDSLRFGGLDKAKNRFLLDGVVGGIAGYGNCMGIPTVGGEIYFDESYDRNPLVNVMAFGLVPADRIVKARASGEGNPVIYVGAKTGRDGIYGVSLLASATFDAEAAEKRPAVQVGDPFTEKILMEACLELIDRDLLVGMQDMGGAGLTCCTSEMSANSGSGMEIDVAKVPRREKGLSPYEVMLSESQERMLLVCTPERLEDVMAVFDKWDLDAVVIGHVTDDGLVRVLENGAMVAEVPAASLCEDGPCYERPFTEPEPPAAIELASLQADVPSEEVLIRLLRDPSVASKRWVYQQYDQTVRFNTVQRPGGEAAVIWLKEGGSDGGVALAIDGNPFYTALDPAQGARLAVAECSRNVACTGARPLGITNCLNFGSPEQPDRMGQFVAAVRGMGEAARALNVPVTGGNVSFYNETDVTPILPTPVVGAVGLIENVERTVGAGFRNAGDAVVLLGAVDHDAARDLGLGGSAWLRNFHDARVGAPPALDLELEAGLQDLLVAAASEGLLHSAKDCADGGLAVALAEACFVHADGNRTDARQAEAPGGPVAGLMGADVEISAEPVRGSDHESGELDGSSAAAHALLFGETASRVVATVDESQLERLGELAAERGVGLRRIGTVVAEPRLQISVAGEDAGPGARILFADTDMLYRNWAGALAEALETV